jgi:uncharacterized protein
MMKTPSPMRADARAALLAAAALCSCSIPPVRLETPEPVKIDVNVKVEIAHEKGAQAAAQAEAPLPPAARRRARMAEVQNLKNSRIVGENRSGYLSVRDIPPAWKAKDAYVREIVEAENADRKAIYVEKAGEDKKPIGEVEKTFAEQCCDKSYSGEWIQTPDGNWRQK